MPLIKSSSVPAGAELKLVKEAVQPTKRVDLQPASLDAKSRQIQRQGAFQAALQSMGVVQHATGSFDDYLEMVRKAAEAELKFINE